MIKRIFIWQIKMNENRFIKTTLFRVKEGDVGAVVGKVFAQDLDTKVRKIYRWLDLYNDRFIDR